MGLWHEWVLSLRKATGELPLRSYTFGVIFESNLNRFRPKQPKPHDVRAASLCIKVPK